MKNINRDYIVDVNVKNSTVSIGNNMKFYITDINTSNIYFKLDINASSNRYIGLYGQKENSDDYSLTLRIINPNNKPFEIIADRMDKPDNFFVVDLTEDQKDQIGTYRCELFIDTDINGRAERSTTNSFTYEVVKSIMNDLDEVIEDAPDFPLVDTFATKEYVDQLVFGDIDLEAYVTDEELAGYSKIDHTHDEYITQTELDDAIGNIDTGNIDLSAYAKLNENATFKNIEARGEIRGLLLDLSDGTALNSASHNMVIGEGCRVTHHNSLVTGYNNYSSCNNQIIAGRIAYTGVGMDRFDRPLIIGNGTEEYVGDNWEQSPTNAFSLDWSGNGVFMGTSTAKSHANSSDRTLKENINYISNALTINDEAVTLAECYNFIKDDLAIATYNYIADEDKAPKIGFIAQDLLYNVDQSDNKVGQLIIDNLQGADMGKGENKLTYDSNNLFGVMLAAMQVMANKIEYLEQKLAEGDN